MRKWVDLFLFYATVIIILSGIVLYIMPHGRVAYFTGWQFLGIDKDGWDKLHVIFGLSMVIVAVWHIVINWKVMKKYLLQKESLISLVVVFIIIAGTLKNIQPFKAVSDLEEYIKSSWEVSKKEIPVAHGELLSLKDFCRKLNIPLEKATEKLKKENIKFNVNETLKSIANKNNLTPYKVYEIIKPANLQIQIQPGSGIGQMTLSEFCKKYNLNLNEVIKKLNSKGIRADKNQTLRNIAKENKLVPADLTKIIFNR